MDKKTSNFDWQDFLLNGKKLKEKIKMEILKGDEYASHELDTIKNFRAKEKSN